MKKITNVILPILCLIFTISCSEDLALNNEEIGFEFEKGANFKSIYEIDDLAFLNQFSQSEKYLMRMLSDNFSGQLTEHNVNDLSVDTENIYVVSDSESARFYTLSIQIPSKHGGEALTSYLTLSFDASTNIGNELQVGYNNQYAISFSSSGELIQDNNISKYSYSPKPSNIPSKAPKSVLCRWASSTGNLGLVGGACGYGIGIGGPPPIEILVSIFPRWYDWDGVNNEWVRRETIRPLPPPPYNGTHNVMDLDIITNPNDLTQTSSFGAVFGYHPYSNNRLRAEIIEFYPKVFVTQASFVANVSPLRLEDHMHKQAFVDSYYQWLFEMQTVAPNTYAIVSINATIQGQLFELFANFNAPNAFSEGVYLNDPDGLTSSNQNLKDMTCMSNYLLTPAGFDFINNPSNLTLSAAGYKSALQYKMYLEQAYCP